MTKNIKNAIIVNDVYKKFGKAENPNAWWKGLLKQNHSANGNGNGNGNGKANGDGSSRKKNGKSNLIVALDRVNFQVREGEVFGVLGPNGSGKSTLIRLMATLLLPDDGNVEVFGYNPVDNPLEVQRMINRVSVEASFFKKLSPMENLIYGARLYGKSGKELRDEIVKVLKRLGLEDRSITSPMEQMSRGMQQKVAIARALLSRPRILLLDEPTTGLDPVSKREVQAVVRELQEQDGTTILLTTHDMVEADILCDRIAIIHNGKIVALDTPKKLKKLAPKVNGKLPTLEDVFIHLTGQKLVEEEQEV